MTNNNYIDALSSRLSQPFSRLRDRTYCVRGNKEDASGNAAARSHNWISNSPHLSIAKSKLTQRFGVLESCSCVTTIATGACKPKPRLISSSMEDERSSRSSKTILLERFWNLRPHTEASVSCVAETCNLTLSFINWKRNDKRILALPQDQSDLGLKIMKIVFSVFKRMTCSRHSKNLKISNTLTSIRGSLIRREAFLAICN